MTLVLLSGGIDSLVCAELARETVGLAGCVFIDYGHPAQIPEGWKAFAYCGERGVPLKAVHAFGLDLGDMASEKGARVVPCRNAVLLALAGNVAKSMGATTLTIGANVEDRYAYPDCSLSFVQSMARAIDMPIRVPLLDTTKAGVILEAKRLGLTPDDAWSCYRPGPKPCGECPSCLESAKAWGP